MAIVKATVLMVLALSQTLALAQNKSAETSEGEPSDTVVFLGQSDLERLVMIEARQDQRRLLTLVPVGAFKQSFKLFIAHKKLTAKDQVRSGSASFLPALFEFSSPRLAVYSDTNPCVDGKAIKNEQASRSVAGIPFFKIDGGATAKFEVINLTKKSPSSILSALTIPEKTQISVLAKAGYGILQVTFAPSKESSGTVKVMPALHIAWEDPTPGHRSQVVGKHGAIVDRLFLAPQTVETLHNVTLTSFPTGIELPAEAAAVFPSLYTDWAAGVLAKEQVIRGYSGPLNRCELCYEKPPTLEVLQSAGVFWPTNLPAVNPATLRGQKADAPSGPAGDTWLSRHVLKKQKLKPLAIATVSEGSSVARSFVEQGSVERPFLGEILCPAMEGYQKTLSARREKNLVALNALNGWNEDKLKTKTDDAGVIRPSWFQQHFEKRR